MMLRRQADSIDEAILRTLVSNPDATNVAVSNASGLARNTVRSRLARYADEGILHSFERRIDPAYLGYPLRAYVITKVVQRKLDHVALVLETVPEVLEVHGLAGVSDLLVHVVARDADDLYRIAGHILSIDGVKRTNTGLVIRELVNYRIAQLIGSDDSEDR